MGSPTLGGVLGFYRGLDQLIPEAALKVRAKKSLLNFATFSLVLDRQLHPVSPVPPYHILTHTLYLLRSLKSFILNHFGRNRFFSDSRRSTKSNTPTPSTFSELRTNLFPSNPICCVARLLVLSKPLWYVDSCSSSARSSCFFRCSCSSIQPH